MNFAQLLDEIYRCGASYSATLAGTLRVDAPAGQLSDALRAALPEHRERLLRHLASGVDGIWHARVAFSRTFGFVALTDPATGEVDEPATQLTPALQSQHPGVVLSPAPRWLLRRAMQERNEVRRLNPGAGQSAAPSGTETGNSAASGGTGGTALSTREDQDELLDQARQANWPCVEVDGVPVGAGEAAWRAWIPQADIYALAIASGRLERGETELHGAGEMQAA